MPFPVQIRRYSNLLQRLLGIQGHVGLTLLDDVSPVLGIADPASPELDFLRGHALRGAQDTVAPGVGVNSRLRLVNRLEQPGVLLVVERILLYATASTNVELAVRALAGADPGLITGTPRDTRLGLPSPLPVSRGRIVGDTVAALGGNSFGRVHYTFDTKSFDLKDPRIVLGPDTALELTAVTVNVGLTVSFWWREYVLAPQEAVSG